MMKCVAFFIDSLRKIVSFMQFNLKFTKQLYKGLGTLDETVKAT